MSDRRRISAAQWWGNVESMFGMVTESLDRARKAGRRETGHDCGHLFRIESRVQGHTSVEGESVHHDAPAFGSLLMSVEVRAHNLRDALLVAASVPLAEWTLVDMDEARS